MELSIVRFDVVEMSKHCCTCVNKKIGILYEEFIYVSDGEIYPILKVNERGGFENNYGKGLQGLVFEELGNIQLNPNSVSVKRVKEKLEKIKRLKI